MKDLSGKLGMRIRYFRIASRMSQGELARASHLTNGYLSDVERGKVNISISNLNLIAEALNISLAVLVDCDFEYDKEQVMKSMHHKIQEMPDDAVTALHRIVLMMSRQKAHLRAD